MISVLLLYILESYSLYSPDFRQETLIFIHLVSITLLLLLNLPRSFWWYLQSISDFFHPYSHFKCENISKRTQYPQRIYLIRQERLNPVWCLTRWWYTQTFIWCNCILSITRCWNFASGSKLKVMETSFRLISMHEAKSWVACVFSYIDLPLLTRI